MAKRSNPQSRKENPSSMDAGEPNESRQRHKGGCALGSSTEQRAQMNFIRSPASSEQCSYAGLAARRRSIA